MQYKDLFILMMETYGLNIQQLIKVQSSWWCIDNFTIINQDVLCGPL